MKFIIPLVHALLGTGGGVAIGMFGPFAAKPEMETAENCVVPGEATEPEVIPAKAEEPPGDREYVKLKNQFIVPILDDDRVRALVVASLSVEVPTGETEAVYSREPKLRDVFLQAMFNHANYGGFEGALIEATTMEVLRENLLEAAMNVLGPTAGTILNFVR